MQVVKTVIELRRQLAHEHSIAFVPTMGNLHAGHIHLVELARQHAQYVVVSIFVNPLQFGANEDLASYPRTLAADCEKLAAVGANMVFTPDVHEIYPVAQTMLVQPPEIADELCGASRPGHFAGVATVVLKLFNMVRPDVAVFGKKDFQQLFIIRQLVQQMNLPIRIIAGETMREPDGLAMSSRNGYLDPAQHKEAPKLFQVLRQVEDGIRLGRRDFPALEAQAVQTLTQAGWAVDYISVRSALALEPAKTSDRQLVVLGAARQGKVRLIDNIEFDIP